MFLEAWCLETSSSGEQNTPGPQTRRTRKECFFAKNRRRAERDWTSILKSGANGAVLKYDLLGLAINAVQSSEQTGATLWGCSINYWRRERPEHRSKPTPAPPPIEKSTEPGTPNKSNLLDCFQLLWTSFMCVSHPVPKGLRSSVLSRGQWQSLWNHCQQRRPHSPAKHRETSWCVPAFLSLCEHLSMAKVVYCNTLFLH